jgi:group I intron endonuclease
MNLLKAFMLCESLWENATDDYNKALATVEVKGNYYKFVTPFMRVSELTKEDFSKAGIYLWQRLPQENLAPAYYVGQAKNLYGRTLQHVNPAKQDSVALHAAIKKYGLDKFVFAVIEFCDAEKLNDRECFWIKELNTYLDKHDYNLTPGGDGGRGLWKVTPEMFEQIMEQLQKTDWPFSKIGKYWGLDRTTIGKLNTGSFEYTKELIKELNIDIKFPVRSEEEIQRISKEASAAGNEKQSKAWRLVLTHSCLNDAGEVVQTGTENLGTFVGNKAAWEEICKKERSDYNTSEEDLRRVHATFRKGNRAAACFGRLTSRQYTRRYTLEKLED